jgi:hypothetical protein
MQGNEKEKAGYSNLLLLAYFTDRNVHVLY